MSRHAAYRRQPVPGEMALRHQTITLPAPVRGIVEVENWAYTKPGCATIIDNWFPTQKGLKLRGGTERWCVLPAPTQVVRSGFGYVSGTVNRMFAATETRLFDVSFADTPVLQTDVGTITNGNFSTTQLANMGGDWLLAVNDAGDYVRRYNGTVWEYLDTAYAGVPSRITGPTTAPALIQDGKGLTHIWKYRNRLFFIQGGTMDAWCLPLNAIGGELISIPLSGAAKKGGSLLFGTAWTVDAGDGIDDKCCFFTDQGEVLIFTGSDPTSSTNWKQEGRYDISKPLGKNGHQQLGGDVLVVTLDGVVPLSAALQKDASALSLAAVSRNIEPMWTQEAKTKIYFPWSIAKWDEGEALFVTFPGGVKHATKTVGVSNLHTGAWSRYVGWDAICFMQMRGSMFFGTQDGKIQQIESTGFDDAHWDEGVRRTVGDSYICKMVGGWEMFQAPPNQVTWLQARTAFFGRDREPFEPQLTATTDYEYRIPPPPSAGIDPGPLDVWDQGVWGGGASWKNDTAYTTGDRVYNAADMTYWEALADHTSPAAPAVFEAVPNWAPSAVDPADLQAAQWDQVTIPIPVRNTMWVSIGETGFSHAPIVQVTVSQQAKPDVELISISATFVRMAANV